MKISKFGSSIEVVNSVSIAKKGDIKIPSQYIVETQTGKFAKQPYVLPPHR